MIIPILLADLGWANFLFAVMVAFLAFLAILIVLNVLSKVAAVLGSLLKGVAGAVLAFLGL